jgi:hypothetical protein
MLLLALILVGSNSSQCSDSFAFEDNLQKYLRDHMDVLMCIVVYRIRGDTVRLLSLYQVVC